jgi:sec-independent protein translocase protein TatC
MTQDTAAARGEMPFLDHLEELRWRILWSLLALVIASVVGFLLVHYLGVMEILIRPIRPLLPEGQRLKFFSPADPFFITLKLALVAGVILSFPVIVYHAWAFLAPALEAHERRVIIPSMYMGLVLFCAGVAMAYFLALPLSLIFLMGFQTDFLEQSIEVGRYLAFVTRLLIAFGVVFELPVVVMILSALGLVTPEFLRSKRRHAIVAITVLASLLSPGDVITVTVLMMAPLILLYEFSILLSRMIYRRRERQELTASPEPPPGAVEAG